MNDPNLTSALLQTLAQLFSELANEANNVERVLAYSHCARIVREVDDNSSRKH